MSSGSQSLAQYIDTLESKGRHVFEREEVREELGLSKAAFKQAAHRLGRKKRLIGTKSGFYVIVPLAYRSMGTLPATWFIDDFMKFHEQPYYVGILSAAQLHGAAHQSPMVFQVVTKAPMRPLTFNGVRIQFFTKKHIEKIPVEKKQTETGYLTVSTPESTAVDLVRYHRAAGQYNNVATVLMELSQMIRPRRLMEAVKANGEVSTGQRLGYLLDRYGEQPLTGPLEQWMRKQKRFQVLLHRQGVRKRGKIDKKWNVVVNEEIEPDL